MQKTTYKYIALLQLIPYSYLSSPHRVGRCETNMKLQYNKFIQTRHKTNLQEFQKFTRVITHVDCAFIMHVAHSSRHIVAIHTRKSPLLTSDWRVANVILIFKKGERSQPGNYRSSY